MSLRLAAPLDFDGTPLTSTASHLTGLHKGMLERIVKEGNKQERLKKQESENEALIEKRMAEAKKKREDKELKKDRVEFVNGTGYAIARKGETIVNICEELGIDQESVLLLNKKSYPKLTDYTRLNNGTRLELPWHRDEKEDHRKAVELAQIMHGHLIVKEDDMGPGLDIESEIEKRIKAQEAAEKEWEASGEALTPTQKVNQWTDMIREVT